MKTLIRTACSLALLLAVAIAADMSGKWMGDVPGRGGDTAPATFDFRVDGEKLTGSVAGAQGDVPIQERKIAGNQISFSTTLDAGGNSIKILYKGALSGDQMKMTSEREGSGQPREFTIKRSGTSRVPGRSQAIFERHEPGSFQRGWCLAHHGSRHLTPAPEPATG